jgi:penicillin amidase
MKLNQYLHRRKLSMEAAWNLNTLLSMLRKFIYVLSLLVLIFIAGSYGYLRSKLPQRSGEISLQGLKSEVDVVFDEWAIPHIETENELDAYRALDYLPGQECLFQLELMVRVAHSRLSEILGVATLDVDWYFCTLGIQRYAKSYVEKNYPKNPPKITTALEAYLSGVNAFFATGSTPLEFTILGIPEREYRIEDLVSISAYMSFTFSNAVHQDPLISHIQKQLGSSYLKDIALNWPAVDT